MSALTKKIEKGQPLGRRDSLRISGTGCICSVPEYREVLSGENDYKFLNIRVVSNSIRKNKDETADQFSEFTDLVISGNRAKALAGILSKGQIVEFGGRLRSRSFDSKNFTDSNGKPAQIYRTECNIGMDGWVNIMRDAAEGKGEKAQMDSAPAAQVGTTDLETLSATLKTLMAQVADQAKTSATPKEEILDLTTADGIAIDDDIPF